MLYRVHHTTTYDYADNVSLSHNLLHLTARNAPNQVCHRTRLLISPVPGASTATMDYFGNYSTFFTIQEPHKKLRITAINITEIKEGPPPDVRQSPPWEQVRTQLKQERSDAFLNAYQFVFDSPYIPNLSELKQYAGPSFTPGRPFLEAVQDLMQRIHGEFTYDPTATSTATPLRDVLNLRKGVCQDFAHLQIGCLRSLGLAARYISGYLLTNPPPGQPRLQGADASHAWLSVYCPRFGWIDFDPTNNMIPTEKHILLAWGRDYEDVSPIKGIILGGGQHTVSVAVDVEEISSIQSSDV